MLFNKLDFEYECVNCKQTQTVGFKLMNKIHTSSIPKQRKGNWTNLGGDSTFSAELHSLCSAAQSLASKYAVWEKCLPKDCLQSYMLLIIRFGLDLQRWDFVEFDDFLVRFVPCDVLF